MVCDKMHLDFKQSHYLGFQEPSLLPLPNCEVPSLMAQNSIHTCKLKCKGLAVPGSSHPNSYPCNGLLGDHEIRVGQMNDENPDSTLTFPIMLPWS